MEHDTPCLFDFPSGSIPTSKTCTRCHVEKSITEYRPRLQSTTGNRYCYCRECEKEVRDEIKQRRRENPPTPPDIKKCSSCGENKRRDDFYSDVTKSDGLGSECKACRIASSNAYYHSQVANQHDPKSGRVCLTCKKFKTAENFSPMHKGLKPHCKECFREKRMQKYDEGNIERPRKRGHFPEIDGKKRCGICTRWLDLEHFPKKKNGIAYSPCRICQLSLGRRHSHVKKYGLKRGDYEKILAEQGGKCAICGKHSSLFEKLLGIDHCHTTGAVRGLLCRACNIGIGNLCDDPKILRAAAKYIEKSRKKYDAVAELDTGTGSR